MRFAERGLQQMDYKRVAVRDRKMRHELDGRLALPPGSGRWVTSPAARRDAQDLRRTVDAIIVGAETVRKDNPRLTIRSGHARPQPWRVVLTKSGKLSRQSNLFQDRYKERTLVYRNQPLEAVLRDLGARGVLSVLVEGGGEILGQMLDRRMIDKVQLLLRRFSRAARRLHLPERGGINAEGPEIRKNFVTP